MKQQLITPAAIIFSGLLIAGALVYSGVLVTDSGFGHSQNVEPRRAANAHIYGNAKAPIRIVEFSDYECPFCGRLHGTLEDLVDEYPDAVAWEYRHLPLPSHRNAVPAAVASECVADLVGNEAFWEFSNQLFATGQFTYEGYEFIALGLGVEQADFADCVADEAMRARVTEDQQIATALGGSGTPFSVVVYPDGTARPVTGALPREQWLTILNLES